MSSLPDLLGGSGTGLAAMVAAIASAVAVVVTALRRRRDLDVVEMQRRINGLDERVKKLEDDLEATRSKLVASETVAFRLRMVLAQHGLTDPTLEASS